MHSSDPPSPWAGYQLSLRSGLDAPTKPTHVLVVQDDTVICRGFSSALERLLEIVPDRPLCLFYPGLKMNSSRAVRAAIQRRRSIFLLDRQDFMPMVAVLWPVEKAQHFLHWSSGVKIPGLRRPYLADDAVAGAWMRLTRQDVYATLPSLVQHPDITPSVKAGPQSASGGADKGRVAFLFREDASEIDWTL